MRAWHGTYWEYNNNKKKHLHYQFTHNYVRQTDDHEHYSAMWHRTNDHIDMNVYSNCCTYVRLIRRWCVTQMMQFIVMQTEFAHPAKSGRLSVSVLIASFYCVMCDAYAFVYVVCFTDLQTRHMKMISPKSFDHFRSSWSFKCFVCVYVVIFYVLVASSVFKLATFAIAVAFSPIIIHNMFVYYNMTFKQCTRQCKLNVWYRCEIVYGMR